MAKKQKTQKPIPKAARQPAKDELGTAQLDKAAGGLIACVDDDDALHGGALRR